MNRIKKAAAGLVLAAALSTGLAAPAHAVTYTHWKFVANCMPYPSAWLKWADYNWWEEMWGARDGYVFSHYVYRYC
jgi:hypothetical protein